MMKLIIKVFVVLVFILVSCKESINEPTAQKYYLNGVIKTNESQSVSYAIISLKGEETYFDTTLQYGYYNFMEVPEGEYIFSITDSSYMPFITNVVLNKDTTINFTIQNKPSDYFPLSVGNWWVYEYKNFMPNQNADIWLFGEMRWEITKFEKIGNDKIYFYDEIINGIEIRGNPINSDLDTTIITNQVSELKFIEQENGFVDIGKDGYFGNYLNIEVQKFHSSLEEYLTFDSYYTEPWGPDTNIIHHYNTGHKIKLQKSVGIVKWNIDNWSNSTPDGDLILVDYFLN